MTAAKKKTKTKAELRAERAREGLDDIRQALRNVCEPTLNRIEDEATIEDARDELEAMRDEAQSYLDDLESLLEDAQTLIDEEEEDEE